jgi:hypothetical protein
MSRTQLLLLMTLIAVPAVPVEAMGQVNLRRYPVQRGDGETLEMDRIEMYQNTMRYRRGMQQQRRIEMLADRQAKEAAYAADACGLGCSDHEGLQVQGIPGTFLSVALYKARVEDDVLTIQLRFHNDGAGPGRLTVDSFGAPASFFVQVGEERLYILEDEEDRQDAKGSLDEVLEPGEIESWWARFPAPPQDATTYDFHIPAVTFRDVPLSDD